MTWSFLMIRCIDALLERVDTDAAVGIEEAFFFGALLDVELSAAKTQINGQIMIISFIRDISRRIDRQYETEVHLPRSIEQITGRVGRVPLKQLVRESTDVIEALCVEAALKLTKDNRAAASELLGLSRQSLYTKLRRFDIGDSEDEVA